MRNPTITTLAASSVGFTTAAGQKLTLQVCGSAVHGELHLGGGDSSIIWCGDPVAAAAEIAEFTGLLAAIEAGKAARKRLAELAGDFEHDIRERIALRDEEDDDGY